MQMQKHSRSRKNKICFTSLWAYPVLAEETGAIGGAEVQVKLLSKKLSDNGFNVSIVTAQSNHGVSYETIDGIKVIKAVADHKTRSNFEHIYHFVTSLWNALRNADSEIYISKGSSPDAGLIALFCLLWRRKYLLGFSSDVDVDLEALNKRSFFGGFLFRLAIKTADCIIAQTSHQQTLCQTNFTKTSIVIKNIYQMTERISKKPATPIVFWAARLHPEMKRPDLFIELAKLLPNAKFQMAGAGTNEAYNCVFRGAVDSVPNLDYVGAIPYHQIAQYFANASIFVNTSPREGFPNTFLQAWGNGIPVVSLNVDPDEIICKYRLGFHSGTFNQMVQDVKRLLDDERLREELGQNGRHYVEREHNIEAIANKYVKVLQHVSRV
jgi:glycosyltransferase involved in cell wall biosynthesis